MAHIRLVEPGEASGALKREYDAAIARSGRVWNIVKTMSPNPAVLAASMVHYSRIMHGPSPLSRVQRELLAVVVSCINECRY
jgi:alkylhydroperoxidase family enzyme